MLLEVHTVSFCDFLSSWIINIWSFRYKTLIFLHNYIIDDQIHTMEFTIKPDKNSQKITLCSVSISNPIYFIYSERQQPKLLLLFTTHQPLFCFWLTIPWHYSVFLFQSVPIISNHTGNSVKEIPHCFAKSFHNLTYFAK